MAEKATVTPKKVDKSEFVTSLILRHSHHKDDGEWVLTNNLVYASKRAQAIITIPASCRTDLASMPRPNFWLMLLAGAVMFVPYGWILWVPVVLWMLFFCMFAGKEDAAAALHDNLYEYELFPRAECDAIFREAAGVTKNRRIDRDGMWLGVRVGGWSHWKRRRNDSM